MKKFFRLFALVAVLGFSFSACTDADNEEGGDGGGGDPVLSGTISIISVTTGTAQVGETLTVNTSALGGSGTISYQWKRGTTNIGENNSTYVVQAADAGSIITVTVTRSGNSGSVTSVGIQIINIPVGIDIAVRNSAEWNTALDTIKNGGNGTTTSPKTYTITVSGNVMVTGNTSNSFGTVSNVAITIKGNGKLYIIGRGSLLNIGINQTVYIDSADLTLQGLKISQNDSTLNNDTAVVSVVGGTLELLNGTISGNSGGSGVRATSGSFTMTDGTISGNNSSNGGGVYASNFTMTGGIISDNSSSNGGGVYASNFTMTGGTISGNSSSTGGGVYASNFTMTGGIISSNICDGTSGGVYASTFIMEGGTISSNTCDFFGGGVFSSNFTMTGGIINGNSGLYGGGVYIGFYVNSTFIKSGGIIYGNDATNIADRNTAKYDGHAVATNFELYRNTTLGLADNISTNTMTGWGQ